MIKNRKCALDATQRRQNISAVVRRLRQKMQNNLAIGGSLKNGPFPFELVTQHVGIN